MIFVTVGTHTQSFNRLLVEMDEIAKNSKEKAIAQIGHSTYIPQHMEWFRFRDSIDDLYKNARLIVCHGGAGSILNALVNNKPVIAIPRYKKYGEHVNDHQIELVKELKQEGKILVIYDIKNLRKAIFKIRKFKKIISTNKICDEIENFLKLQKYVKKQL